MKKYFLIAISVMIFFAMSINCFAASAPEFVPQSGYDFFQYQLNTGENYVWMWEHSDNGKIQDNPTDNGVFFNLPNGTQLYQYFYNESRGTWGMTDKSYTLSSTGLITLVMEGNYSYTYSSVNIYNYGSNEYVVFQPTPPLEEVVAEEMNNFLTTTNQTVSIVVLCGVGCLALLIGLNLLRRKSVIFLNR